MIYLKTREEIAAMKEGGAILREVADQLVSLIQPGISTNEIDAQAEKMIRERGAKPSFKRVKGYKWTTCVPINEQAVHTPPSNRKLKEGDVLTIDIGVYHKGLHTDYATTEVVGGQSSPEIKQFLQKGRDTLDAAIKQIHAGERMGVISQFIEQEITGAGYFILKELTGHGIGKELHEDPYVFNYLEGPIEKTYVFQPGLTIAVEIIYSLGTEGIAYEPHVPWSIITKDRSLSACFEHSIAVTDEETFILA